MWARERAAKEKKKRKDVAAKAALKGGYAERMADDFADDTKGLGIVDTIKGLLTDPMIPYMAICGALMFGFDASKLTRNLHPLILIAETFLTRRLVLQSTRGSSSRSSRSRSARQTFSARHTASSEPTTRASVRKISTKRGARGQVLIRQLKLRRTLLGLDTRGQTSPARRSLCGQTLATSTS